MTNWLGLPALASAHGADVDRTLGLVHILMLTLFVGWGIFFLYTLWRFRRSRQRVADYTGVKSHASSWVEVTVALVEALLLFGFSVPIWAKRVNQLPPEKNAVVVEVTAEQFAWNIHYPGPDGIFGKRDIALIDMQTNPLGLDRSSPGGKDDVVTLNQLYLPVNRPVIVKLRSKDVIHSFNLPEFRVKQDAIPGFTIPTWFTPTVTTAEMRGRTGNPEFQYEIACAQLCGLGHYRMRGYVTILSQPEFDSWMAAEEAKLSEAGEEGGFWE
jgi:cytochrome c oxidase subunit 2